MKHGIPFNMMNGMTKPLLHISLVAGLLVVPGFGWADSPAGQGAHDGGDFGFQLRVWRPLAEQGDADAQYLLGLRYDLGQGVPQDLAEAAMWYRRAAAQGNARAQSNLGVIYFMGKGVRRDHGEAARWLRLAAEQGDGTAQYFLGMLYERGQGVSRDHGEAAKWFRQAADQGNIAAKLQLGLR